MEFAWNHSTPSIAEHQNSLVTSFANKQITGRCGKKTEKTKKKGNLSRKKQRTFKLVRIST
jgi:hypothetical protein